ncbi:MAG: DUF2892 domain-containing protein [Chitinophagaceae bacterium]|nr:DUF2892 domain-containing protein [Bauldia sp.]MCW5929955.1 DUF2892 domain-containing protein [Chitinophagaceae bacterium]
MDFAQSAFAQFLAGGAGRLTRIVAGVALIWVGIAIDQTFWSAVLYIVGAVPILAAVFDVCLITALFGGPFAGRRVRSLAR